MLIFSLFMENFKGKFRKQFSVKNLRNIFNMRACPWLQTWHSHVYFSFFPSAKKGIFAIKIVNKKKKTKIKNKKARERPQDPVEDANTSSPLQSLSPTLKQCDCLLHLKEWAAKSEGEIAQMCGSTRNRSWSEMPKRKWSRS